MKIIERDYGEIEGEKVKLYTLSNDNGLQITCMDYGCTITSILMPDKNGKLEEIVLGFDSLEEYINHTSYFGCIIGRSAGRIQNASFELKGETYSLSKNEGKHNLHGGYHGFHAKKWNSVVEQQTNHAATVFFTRLSPDGEEGFPGNLQIKVSYTLTNDNEFFISYYAVTDSSTIVNLTNHTYFNLSGDAKRTVLNHELKINSNEVLELDSDLIPTGRIIHVEGTVFDLRKGQKLKTVFESDHPQITLVGGGFDHPFILNNHHQQEIVLLERESGRKVVVETVEPSVVVYTGNSLEGMGEIRKSASKKHLGLCLETQKPPHKTTPTCVIDKNNPYRSLTKYTFSLLNDE